MRIGQTSLIVFLSKVVGSALGFIATIYFARVLGAEILGIYAVIVALVAWMELAGRAGVGKAVVKRVSEGEDQGAYLAAGAMLIFGIGVIVCAAVFFGQQYVESYVGGFEEHVQVSVVWFVMALFVMELVTTIVYSTLHGQNLVHIVGLLKPVSIGVRSTTQIGLILLFGLGLVGMLVGRVFGLLVVTCVGALFVSVRPEIPSGYHFRKLFDYAKFSWLGSLKSRAFNDVDILILGWFVSSKLVGVYSVAWSLTKFLDLFGGAIGQAMFPEISNVSAQKDPEAASKFIKDSVAYAGFVTIPGLVGGGLLADRLFRIYGDEFVQGTKVLWLLLLSILLFSYMHQFLNALNAIDRPDYAFRVNAVFIVTNATLNLVLIWQLGWIGAAIASVMSSIVGLVLSYKLLVRLVNFELPLLEISKQVIAAVGMGAVVAGLRKAIEATGVIQHNFVILLGLVAIGATTYVALLITISPKFRGVVTRNAPVDLTSLT